MSGKEKVITESIQILPEGRGRVCVIAHKRILKKPKLYKRKNPRLSLIKIKSNPQDFSIVSYINDDIVRHILFPEGRILSYEEREKIAIACLLTLPVLLTKVRSVSGTYKRHRNDHAKHCRISQELREKLDVEYRRYVRWRLKNN